MRKIIKWIGVILGLFILIVLLVPVLFKGKIVTLIQEEANKNLNAKLAFKDVSLSLIKNFPNLSVGIDDLSIINEAPFKGDTLIYAKQFALTVDVMSVIKGEKISIRKVNVDSPVTYLLINKDGKVNWDIAKPDSSKADQRESSAFKASLDKYTINNGLIVYDDRTMPFMLRMEGVNHSGSGDFTQDLFVLSTLTAVKKLDLYYGGIKYISRAVADAKADIDMDMKNMKFTFKDNKIALNDLDLGFSGWVAMPDTNIDMDLKYSAAKSDFKNFISMIPAVYSDNFKDVQSSGKMGFDGFIKGRFNAVSMPGFGINLLIDNGMFKYPALPAALKNVFVNLKVINPDGISDHTAIDLSRFHMEMNNDPFDAKLSLRTPVSDPNIDAFMKGKIDLGNIQKLVPLEKGITLSGLLNADLTAKGRMSSIEKKQYDQFNAGGNLQLTGFTYSDAANPDPVIISTLSMSVVPQKVTLNSFNARIGKSDFNANGSLENVLNYALKDETLKGNLNFTSSLIDLNQFMGGETTTDTKADTSKLSVIEVPGNIDFTLNASIRQLLYQNLQIDNVNGKLIVKDKSVRLDNLKMSLMNGSVIMNGGYSSANIAKPSFDFGMNITNFDIQKTVISFVTVEKLAPIAKNCSGSFSCNMTVNGLLDPVMSPVMNSLTGNGKLTTSAVTIDNFPVFVKVADALKMNNWKKFVVPPINPSFRFTNGRVFVDPFDMNVNGIKATVAGSNGFDQTIDYTMATQIPRSSFGGAANSVLNNLIASANAKGANFSVGDIVPVNLKITGTVKDPKVATDLNKAGAKAMDDIKAQAKAEFEKQKAEVEAKARAEAERLKAEGQARLDAEKAKAQAEADRLKKEAEAKAKAEADRLKKQAEEEAKKKLNQLNPFKK